jgi:mercuric ion transport protein
MKAGVRDSLGVFGAVLAALCCAGTPFVIGGLTAVGLGFLRKDGILWPVMLLALAIAVSGFWRGAQTHGRWGPLIVGGTGAVSLASGVIVVHGFPAMPMIYAGATALVAAAAWNSYARRSCNSVSPRPSAV